MKEIYFGDFRALIIDNVKTVEKRDIESYSTEWFLIKYLRRIIKSTEDPTTPGRVEGAVRSLVRFYIDNIDERSELGEQCLRIYEEYRKTLRLGQTQHTDN